MRVFIAGATGVLGRRLAASLRRSGHTIVGLARSDSNEERLGAAGVLPVRVDLFDRAALARAVEGCDVVVHAATAIPTGDRITADQWAANDRIRRDGTRALAGVAADAGARCYVQQSIVWVARPHDERWFDEETPPGDCAPVYQSALDAEMIARDMCAGSHTAVAILRAGMFYAHDAAHTRGMAERLHQRGLPIIGRGKAHWSCVHADDAAAAFHCAIERCAHGLWHIVDDAPVLVADFLRTFAREIGAPPPRRVPAWLARLIAGDYAVRFLTTTTYTTNARARAELGWTPTYQTVRDGLRQVARVWRTEGWPEA